MEKRIKNYLRATEDLLALLEKGEAHGDLNGIISEHLVQIGFFSHERLIHLIVTALFAILDVMAFLSALRAVNIFTILLTVALTALLIPYIRHYYILENGVQKMYEQYDRLSALKAAWNGGGARDTKIHTK